MKVLLILTILTKIIQTTSLSESAQLSRTRLSSVLSSLSGKLTLSPEIIIPEPTDPTALLLQNDKITKLSEAIRTKAKANAAFLSASTISSLQTFVLEQEEARGGFPGPVPVIVCNSKEEGMTMQDIAKAGAEGIVLPFLSDMSIVIDSVDTLKSYSDDIDTCFVPLYKEALGCGLQGIPEIVLDGSSGISWSEDCITQIVDFLKEKCENDGLPVALILSMQGELQASEEDEPILNLPQIPTSLKKTLPILGSVRVLAGENRMSWYISKLKSSGYTGAFLRADCVPGFRLNPDLQQVSSFWSACIGDLKSTKSKAFGFRAKVNVMIERDVPMEWYNLQRNVMESGALGGESHRSMDDLDADRGDFKGF